MKKIFYQIKTMLLLAGLFLLLDACKRDKQDVFLQPRNERDIVEVMQRETKGDFTMFLEALKVTGLDQLLSVEPNQEPSKRYMVFAPTNDAFATLLLQFGANAVNQIDPTVLAEVLKAHIYELPSDAPKKVTLEDIGEGTFNTLKAGKQVSINFSCDGVPYINGKTVVAFEREAKNGRVVAIENVLITPEKSLLEILSSDPNCSVFYQLLELTGRAGQFADLDKHFTVFVPDNQNLLLATAAGYPLSLNPALITPAQLSLVDSIVAYHIIEGRSLYQLSVCPGEPYVTQLKQDIQIDANGILNGRYADWVGVSTGNAQYAKNGVIHYLDYPLLPASENIKQKVPQMPEDLMNPDDSYIIARQALAITGLIDELDKLDRITLMLPTDKAFANFFALNNLNSIYDIPVDKLTEIMKFHVITRRAFINDFAVNPRMKTLQMEEFPSLALTNTNYVVSPYFYAEPTGRIDVKMSNGNIQCIRKVQVPKAVNLKQVP